MAVGGGLVEELLVLLGEQRPRAVGLERDRHQHSRSGVECQAQLNTSRWFGTTSR